MKGFLKWLLIAAAGIIGVYFLGGFLIPQQWTVTRSIVMNASNEHIYEEVANLRNWQNWAPWNMQLDPTQVYSYEGPEVGAGAKWLWTGEKMGKGYLEIKKADEKTGIVYELFIDMNDMQSTIEGVMEFKDKDGQTEVVWSDRGDSGNSTMRRWMSLLIGKMLGDEMDDGLKKLKALVESKPKTIEKPPVAEAAEEVDAYSA